MSEALKFCRKCHAMLIPLKDGITYRCPDKVCGIEWRMVGEELKAIGVHNLINNGKIR